MPYTTNLDEFLTEQRRRLLKLRAIYTNKLEEIIDYCLKKLECSYLKE